MLLVTRAMLDAPPNGLRVSRRLAAFANATDFRLAQVPKRKKSYDLVRRKAVGLHARVGP